METLRAIAEGVVFAFLLVIWIYSSMALAVVIG